MVVWTINANAGDKLLIRAEPVERAGTLFPFLRLYSPTGVLLDQDARSVAEVGCRATNNGPYVVVVSSGGANFNTAGSYRLTLARTGEGVSVSAGDEGGTLTNGFAYKGNI